MVNVLFWLCTFLYVMEPKLSGYGFLAFREGEKYFITLYECSELQCWLIPAELSTFCLSHCLRGDWEPRGP